MVGYCYNKYECWSGSSVLDMHACGSKFKVKCNCGRHGKWLDAIVTDMVDGLVQM